MANLSGRYRDAPLPPAPLRARPPHYQPSPPEATFATIDGPALTRHRPPEPRVYTGLRSWWYILWVWTNGEGHVSPITVCYRVLSPPCKSSACPPPFPASSPESHDPVTVPRVSPLPECHTVGITQHAAFPDWLFHSAVHP